MNTLNIVVSGEQKCVCVCVNLWSHMVEMMRKKTINLIRKI